MEDSPRSAAYRPIERNRISATTERPSAWSTSYRPGPLRGELAAHADRGCRNRRFVLFSSTSYGLGSLCGVLVRFAVSLQHTHLMAVATGALLLLRSVLRCRLHPRKQGLLQGILWRQHRHLRRGKNQ